MFLSWSCYGDVWWCCGGDNIIGVALLMWWCIWVKDKVPVWVCCWCGISGFMRVECCCWAYWCRGVMKFGWCCCWVDHVMGCCRIRMWSWPCCSSRAQGCWVKLAILAQYWGVVVVVLLIWMMSDDSNTGMEPFLIFLKLSLSDCVKN